MTAPFICIQIRDDATTKPDALGYTKEEMDQIGAMLYREADAALRCLANSRHEGAYDAVEGGSTEDSHRGRSEPAGSVSPSSMASSSFSLCLLLDRLLRNERLSDLS
ncbi:hypothetical protein BDV28DRAFT_143736 [Aspergillus coremiiformis]|uniref:Uncharacterized protein n=1 Tax=Aspergillus coremiiformis TaxID=138285 RepID=A0A5N6YT87_9EURO|nr:hypothetical protein BDV28DRAFT_143736 [Aspergillus coremiiformis]